MSKLKLDAIGHLGHDCSIRHMDSGSSAINFTIACTEKYVDRAGNKHEKTTWLDCVLWRKPEKLKIADYLKKGTLVSVEGKPDVRAWTGREGDARAVMQLRVDNLILLGGVKNSGSVAETASATNENKIEETAPVFTSAAQEDDLPF